MQSSKCRVTDLFKETNFTFFGQDFLPESGIAKRGRRVINHKKPTSKRVKNTRWANGRAENSRVAEINLKKEKAK